MTGLRWTEDAERIVGVDNPLWGHVGEDDRGDLWLPAWDWRNYWNRPLNLHRPTHWLPYLRSRLGRKLAWLEAA